MVRICRLERVAVGHLGWAVGSRFNIGCGRF